MPKKKRLNWEEISRRGRSHHVLFIDSVIEAYKSGLFGRAHRTNWSPQYYRQFDNARSYAKEDLDNYINLLRKCEEKKPGRLLANAEEYEKRITKMRQFVNKVKHVNFSNKSSKELSKIFSGWFNLTVRMWCFAYDYIVINKFLPDEIMMRVAQRERDVMKQNEYLGILFMAERPSEVWQEKKALLRLAKYLRQKKLSLISPLIDKKINQHLKKFAYLGRYYFRGQAYTKEIIKNRLKEYYILGPVQFEKLQIDLQRQMDNARQSKQLIKQLWLDDGTIHLIKMVKRWGWLSNYVDETYSYGVHYLNKLWLTIADRLGLDSINELASLRGAEIIRELRKKKLVANLSEIAQERFKSHAIILEKGKVRILSGASLKRYANKETKEVRSLINVKMLKGQPASAGFVTGKVRVIYSPHDLIKFERKEIMVVDATNPMYVPAMEKAAAIITDEGGLLCHAAIVSRELGIPCVVGTKIATKVLHDGQLVEVDASKGIVKIIK